MRKMLLGSGMAVCLIACAPVAGTNYSKNPYKDAPRYEPLSAINVKSGETTYATVSYSEKYWDGDFSKLVDRSVVVPDSPRKDDVYASELSGMLSVKSISPSEGVSVQIAYVEARREIDSTYDNTYESGYYYYDSVDVTYRIVVEKDVKSRPIYYTVKVNNNYKNEEKTVLLNLKVDGKTGIESLLDEIVEEGDKETPKDGETPKPETPQPEAPKTDESK